MNSSQTLVIVFIALGLLVFTALLARNFRNFNLRVKVVLGILLTGGIALGIFAYFVINNAIKITNSLSQRLDTSVGLLAEAQLDSTATLESEYANQFFNDIKIEVERLAEYRISLEAQKAILSQGTYWDAATNLTQLEGGQYGNSPSDTSSVFVPVNITLDESILAELNITSYLDFSTPQLLKANPSILAIYYIDPKGVVRYYPNIELASVLPPDFDATQRPYYEITAPLFNPQRLTRWTIPYVDATGGGLVVTAAAPVYIASGFNGIVAADIQLSRVEEQISSIKIGQTGYAFMIDDAGRIITMPPAGYELFGINPDTLNPDDFFKQTVLGEGSDELRSITNRMTSGGSGLHIIQVNGIDTYLAYSPVKANGYNIALVVPVTEMQGAIAAARTETQAQIRTSIIQAGLILAGLLLAAVVISLAIGQVIAAPVVRLTQTANQVVSGDMTAQAVVDSNDEIGILAQAFNTMTSRLRDVLTGLEQRVAQRTAELDASNQRVENRAKQFESISLVARSISSTRDLDKLLNEITLVINREFGFYHVGIFLLDTAREYAVLSAANSAGGRNMLERGHRLKVGETGIVGFVTSTGRPRVALDTGTDVVFFNNPDLPETRSEVALPLLIENRIIGALDVQSTEPNAFNQEDVEVLSTLADQVSIAIQNAQQYEETRKALSESESLSKQFIQTGWSQFTRLHKIEGIRHTGAKATLLYKKKDKGTKADASDKNELTTKDRGAVLSLPIKLRGEVIGSVDIRSQENRQWDQDELDIVTAIIERAAIAMESSRLLEEAQRRASREQAIGEMSASIGTFTDTEAILRATVNEIAQKIGGARVVFELGTQDEEAKRGNSK